MGKIIVVGSSNTDLVVSSKKLPSPGETVLGGDFGLIAGGKGANQAVAAARAGSYVTKEIALADVVLVQLEIPIETVEYVLKIAKENNVKTILNPAPAPALSDEILAMVDIITPNETETEILIGIDPRSEQELKEASDKLLSKVREAVLITLGEKGVYYTTRNGEYSLVPTLKVQAVDTTAAGDVFNGFFASALSDGKGFKAAIEIANKAAAISVTKKGAQPSIPTINDINRLKI